MVRVCLFCKSYLPDLDRLETLVETVRCFNEDELNFFVSVPQSDLAAFRNRLGSEAIEWLRDEDIVDHSSPDAASSST